MAKDEVLLEEAEFPEAVSCWSWMTRWIPSCEFITALLQYCGCDNFNLEKGQRRTFIPNPPQRSFADITSSIRNELTRSTRWSFQSSQHFGSSASLPVEIYRCNDAHKI